MCLLSLLNPYRRRSRKLDHDPVFILGHWRSGTTWLHETLALDDRFIAPELLEVSRPYTFETDFFIMHVLEKLHLISLAPCKRPMDNIMITHSNPMEDEFALLSMGLPSELRRSFFFNNYGVFSEHQGWEGLSRKQIAKCCRKWIWLLGRVQARGPGRQMLLKSPQHSWRVAEIRKVFPNAKFILIVRRPEDVYASLKNQMKTYYTVNSLSRSVPSVTEEEFLENYLYMHEKLLSDMENVGKNAFTIVRYEDLRENTMREISRIYRDLALENATASLKKISAEIAKKPPYKMQNLRRDDFTFTGTKVTAFRMQFGYHTSGQPETRHAEGAH